MIKLAVLVFIMIIHYSELSDFNKKKLSMK